MHFSAHIWARFPKCSFQNYKQKSHISYFVEKDNPQQERIILAHPDLRGGRKRAEGLERRTWNQKVTGWSPAPTNQLELFLGRAGVGRGD